MFVGSVAALSLVNTAEAAVNCELTFTPPDLETGTCITVYADYGPYGPFGVIGGGVGASFGGLVSFCTTAPTGRSANNMAIAVAAGYTGTPGSSATGK